ncbi:MAG: peptide chain release factor N(5)-glutamine methyltransferase [bacterium]|nr:peptide chain release factor N(5)-glutamine methyltransferase [bacterium]
MNTPCTAKKLLFDVDEALEEILGESRSAAQEARAILEHVLKTDVVKILADLVGNPSPEQIDKIREIVDERKRRKPLAYILGNTWFYNNSFFVTDGVLVPRPETEILVDEAVRFIKSHKKHNSVEIKVLDLYTGSGNVILSITDECEAIIGTGVDSDKGAISCAEKNRTALRINSIDFRCIDTAEFLNSISITFDLITANPPYIPTLDISSLQPEISLFENPRALDGGRDGLDHFRILALNAKKGLGSDGILLSEIGIDQKEPISDLFSGWTGVQFIDDLNGIPRVLRAIP